MSSARRLLPNIAKLPLLEERMNEELRRSANSARGKCKNCSASKIVMRYRRILQKRDSA